MLCKCVAILLAARHLGSGPAPRGNPPSRGSPHLLALLVEDEAVRTGRCAGGDQAHSPLSHALGQLLLDHLRSSDACLQPPTCIQQQGTAAGAAHKSVVVASSMRSMVTMIAQWAGHCAHLSAQEVTCVPSLLANGPRQPGLNWCSLLVQIIACEHSAPVSHSSSRSCMLDAALTKACLRPRHIHCNLQRSACILVAQFPCSYMAHSRGRGQPPKPRRSWRLASAVQDAHAWYYIVKGMLPIPTVHTTVCRHVHMDE